MVSVNADLRRGYHINRHQLRARVFRATVLCTTVDVHPDIFHHWHICKVKWKIDAPHPSGFVSITNMTVVRWPTGEEVVLLGLLIIVLDVDENLL